MAWSVVTWIGEHPTVFWRATGQHLALSGAALLAALLVALPAAIVLLRRPGASGAAVALANVLRTIPSLALLVVMLPSLGTGFPPAVVALTLYGIPTILINALAGLRGIDPDIIEAARGQGLSPGQITRRIEIPLALPVIFAGIRTAAVQIVSAATLAAFIGGGGLGELITAGMGTFDIPQLVVGGIAVAAVAFATELVFGLGERLTVGASAA
jgi:osmoprotectant transport system permease protein